MPQQVLGKELPFISAVHIMSVNVWAYWLKKPFFNGKKVRSLFAIEYFSSSEARGSTGSPWDLLLLVLFAGSAGLVLALRL